MQPPSMEPFNFIHPGELQGLENKYKVWIYITGLPERRRIISRAYRTDV